LRNPTQQQPSIPGRCTNLVIITRSNAGASPRASCLRVYTQAWWTGKGWKCVVSDESVCRRQKNKQIASHWCWLHDSSTSQPYL